MVRISLSFVLVLCSCCVVSAQFTPVKSTFSTPMGKVTVTDYRYTPMHYYYGQAPVSGKYSFYIILKNDSAFTAKTAIDISDNKKQFVTVKVKKEKHQIFPADTKTISRIPPEGKQLVGIPADSCWLFQCASGKINSYSFLAEPGMLFVSAIQYGNDAPIVPLNKENLVAIVGTENEKVNKLIERGKLIKAVSQFNEDNQ